MKVLVTGATGFIGSHAADLLAERGFNVRCLVRKTSNLRWLEGKNFELVDGSLSDIASLEKAVAGVDIIIHSAGLVAARNYEGYLAGNRDGTRNLLQAAQKFAPGLKRFLYVSSQTAGGPSESLEHPIDEESPSRPLTSYGKSKLAAEEAVMEFKNIFPVTILRPTAIYGPRDESTFPIFKTAKMGIGTLIGFGKKYVGMIHSSDLARAIADAAVSEATIGKIYYIGSDVGYDWTQVMNAIKNGFGNKYILKIRIPHFLVWIIAALSDFFGRFAKEPPVFNFEKANDFVAKYWTCSIEKAKKDFGYSQQISLEDGMADTARWYKENKWL